MKNKLAEALAKAPTKKIAKQCVTALTYAYRDKFISDKKIIYLTGDNADAIHTMYGSQYKAYAEGFIDCAMDNED